MSVPSLLVCFSQVVKYKMARPMLNVFDFSTKRLYILFKLEVVIEAEECTLYLVCCLLLICIRVRWIIEN